MSKISLAAEMTLLAYPPEIRNRVRPELERSLDRISVIAMLGRIMVNRAESDRDDARKAIVERLELAVAPLLLGIERSEYERNDLPWDMALSAVSDFDADSGQPDTVCDAKTEKINAWMHRLVDLEGSRVSDLAKQYAEESSTESKEGEATHA